MKRLVLLLALLPLGCARSPDEKMIREAVAATALAAERKDSAGVVRHLSPDFRDGSGEGRAAFRGMLEEQFRSTSRSYVFVSGLKVQLTGDSADVSLRVALSGSSRFIPERGRLYDVSSVWRKEAGGWRVVRAWWAPG